MAPYPVLLREDSGQRDHDLREVFNGLRCIALHCETGRALAVHAADLPPWAAVYQQVQR